jgi:hypothetical protein
MHYQFIKIVPFAQDNKSLHTYIHNDYITAIIHVPASASPNIFKLYKYIPFPIPFNKDHILTIHTDKDIIAVGPKKKEKQWPR